MRRPWPWRQSGLVMNQRRIRRTVPNDHISKLGTNSTARDQPPGGRHAPEQDRPGHFAPMKEPRHLTPAFFLDPPGVTSAQAGSSQDSPEEQFALPLH